MEAPSVSCPFDSSYEGLSQASSFPGSAQGSKQSDEEFFGNDLKTYFDKEEKKFLISSLDKTGQEKSYLTPAQSFMAYCNDSLMAQKLTISQYIAARSEPLGHLGDSSCSLEQPYFSYTKQPSITDEVVKMSPKPSIVPDFSEEPSWLDKKSLSLLSSSEDIGLESSAEQTSENWLLPPSAKPAVEEFKVPAPVPAKKKSEPDDSELPSLYWKPAAADMTNIDAEKQAMLDDCVSYLAGHIDGVKVLPSHPKYSSTQVMAAQDSINFTVDYDAKSTRLSDQSLISEPQLSSTREVTCDEADQSSMVSKVSTVRNNNNQPSPQLSMGRSSNNSSNKPITSNHEIMCDKTDQIEQNDTLTQTGDVIKSANSSVPPASKTAAYNPETWISLFTNTSSLSTPLLMNKVKEHILCIKGTNAHPGTITFTSSGAGESGFDLTATNVVDRSASSSGSLTGPSPTPSHTEQVPPFLAKSVEQHQQQFIPPKESPRESVISQETSSSHSRASSSSRDSLPSPRTSERYAFTKEETSSKNSFLKCNKSQIFFGTAKLGDKQTGKLIIRNSSYEDGLILDMCIKDTASFRIVDDGKQVMNSRAMLEPRHEQTIILCFQPTAVGSETAKLNIYPRSQSKKVKYSVDLLGYGGSSNVSVKNLSRARTVQPYFNGKSWNCSLSLENTGNAAGFVCIVPVFEPESSIGMNNCVIMPSTFVLKEGAQSLTKVFIHCSQPNISMKLQIYSVDEAVRACWRKCMEKGLPPQLSEANDISWHRFWDPSEFPITHTVCEDDVLLFAHNLKKDVVTIASSDAIQNSNFLSLAMETATLLDHSSLKVDHTLPPALPTIQRDAVKSVTLNVNEIVFPPTKVGTFTTLKIPLQNWSAAIQEVEVREIQEPFRLKQLQCKIPGGYFFNLPITFQPSRIGNFSCVIVFEIKGLQSVLRLPVRGVST